MAAGSRTAPLRRTGSLLGLLALEVAAVLGLHWLGRFPGLQVRWDEPVTWLLDSPIQNVLGSLLRMVALVMAYWLLASTVAYLLASLTRLPGAVRAVGWATLPLVRRVADHAVAVTLATSMVGTTTLGVAGPALAADSRSLGPPAPKPVAAAGATGSGAQDATTTTEPGPTTTAERAYTPDPAGQVPTSAPKATPPPPTTEPEPAAEPEPAPASKPVYTPDPADQAPRRLQENQPATAAPEGATTSTAGAAATTAGTTATTAGAATGRSEAATSTRAPAAAAPAPKAPATTAAPTTPTTTAAAPAARSGAAAPTTASTATTREGDAARVPATTHAYVPNAASDSPESGMANPGSTTTTKPGGGSSNRGSGPSNSGSGSPNQGGSDQGTGREEEPPYRVKPGDNLWKIARDHLLSERSGGSGEPTNHEVAAYWVKVVEANRDLPSGDPDLIYPGDPITLPPVD
jgi:hypothetical protein